MIFKTFDSKIDKWTSKIGIFGKSFNELGTAVNEAFKSVIDNFDNFDKNVGFRESLKNNLFSKQTDKDWIKNSFGDIISKENIDSYIKELDLESAKEKLSEIFNWNTSIKNNETTWEKFFDTCKGGNEYLIDLIKNTDDLSKLTGEDLVDACNEARESAIAHNEEIKNMSFSAKAGKVAFQALATAGNMLAMWLISKGIELAVKGIDNLIHSAEHCKERVDGLMSSYQSAINQADSNAKTVEDLASRYEELSKGVNNLGENVSLTTDEYSEYNKIVNQIADMFPSMIQGYTNEGNAILSLKGNVEQLRNAYKEAQQEAYNMLIVSGKDSDGNDIIKNYQNVLSNADSFIKTDSSAKEYVEIIKSLQEAMFSSDEEYKKLYVLMTTPGNNNKLVKDSNMSRAQFNKAFKMLQDIGFQYDLTNEDKRNISNTANSYIQTYQAEIDNALKGVQTLANAYLMTNEDYALLDEQSQNIASIIINSINENIAIGFEDKTDVGSYVASIIDTLKDNPGIRAALVSLFTENLSELSPTQAKDVVDQYITKIAEALHEDELELKIRLGFEDVDTIARNYNAVMKNAAAKFTGTDLSGFTRNIFRDKSIPDSDGYSTFEQEMKVLEAFAEENSINTQDEIAFWNKCIEESETREQAMEKYLSSPFITGEETPTPSLSNTIAQLNTQLKPAFDSLKSAYQDIFISDDKITLENVDISILDSMKSKLDDLNAIDGISIDYFSFENLARVLTDTSSTAGDVQTAFNLLATDIVTGPSFYVNIFILSFQQ